MLLILARARKNTRTRTHTFTHAHTPTTTHTRRRRTTHLTSWQNYSIQPGTSLGPTNGFLSQLPDIFAGKFLQETSMWTCMLTGDVIRAHVHEFKQLSHRAPLTDPCPDSYFRPVLYQGTTTRNTSSVIIPSRQYAAPNRRQDPVPIILPTDGERERSRRPTITQEQYEAMPGVLPDSGADGPAPQHQSSPWAYLEERTAEL